MDFGEAAGGMVGVRSRKGTLESEGVYEPCQSLVTPPCREALPWAPLSSVPRCRALLTLSALLIHANLVSKNARSFIH